jgi:large subunit ribosomal protein L4e
MCRGGRMFAPTKTWRKWNCKINNTQKRYAVASALAASAVPSLVMARGHVIDEVPEVPLVLDKAIESTIKTSAAKDILAAVGALDDVEKAANSKQIRAGKGKMRNRRYTLRRGPLIIYQANDGVEKAFRNLPGVELCCVDRLNLLQLAPGGHMGRFCVWSQAAFDSLDVIYGDDGKRIPIASMTNADLARIINSDEIQSVLNTPKPAQKIYTRKANPLRNTEALEKLDPYAAAKRRAQKAGDEARAKNRDAILAKRREMRKVKKQYRAQGKAFYEQASKQGSVCENGFEIS